MRQDKTQALSPENGAQVNSEPAQPMLRGVNLAKNLRERLPSICVDPLCLPWDHETDDCVLFRQSAAYWRA